MDYRMEELKNKAIVMVLIVAVIVGFTYSVFTNWV